MEFVSSKKNDLTVIEVKVTMSCKCGRKSEVPVDVEITYCCWYPDDIDSKFITVKCPHCGAEYEKNIY